MHQEEEDVLMTLCASVDRAVDEGEGEGEGEGEEISLLGTAAEEGGMVREWVTGGLFVSVLPHLSSLRALVSAV